MGEVMSSSITLRIIGPSEVEGFDPERRGLDPQNLIRLMNILMVGSTFEALRGFVLGFWMETIGVAIRTTADPNLDATPFGVALSLIPLSTRTFYVCDLFGVS